MAAGTTFTISAARAVAACSISVLATLAVPGGAAAATDSVPVSSDVADPTLGPPASLPALTTVAPDTAVPPPTTVPATVTPTTDAAVSPPATAEPPTTLIPAVSLPEATPESLADPPTTLIPAASFPEVAVPVSPGEPVTTLIPAVSMPERTEPNSPSTTDRVTDIAGPAEVAPVRPAPVPVASESAQFDPVVLPVAGSSASSQPILPATGSETEVMLLIAALGVLGGVSLVALSRRGAAA